MRERSNFWYWHFLLTGLAFLGGQSISKSHRYFLSFTSKWILPFNKFFGITECSDLRETLLIVICPLFIKHSIVQHCYPRFNAHEIFIGTHNHKNSDKRRSRQLQLPGNTHIFIYGISVNEQFRLFAEHNYRF